MATKPSGNPNVWAQTANYPAGAEPWSSNATKVTAPTETTVGFTPETGITAEYANAFYNETSQWTEWASFGSFDPDLDAHIVETNGVGAVTIALGIFGGTASAFTALFASENSASTAITAHFQNTVGGDAVRAQANTGHALNLIQDTDAIGTPGAIAQTVRTNEPTTVGEGDLSFRGGDYHRSNFYDGAAWQYVHGSAGGFVRKYGEVAAEANTISGGTLSSHVFASLTTSDNAVAGTTVHLRAVCEVGTSVAGSIIKLGIVDGTAGGTPIISEGDGGAGTQRTIRTFQGTGAADERYAVIEVDYVLPLSGVRIFFLGFISDGANTSYIRFASLEVTGAF